MGLRRLVLMAAVAVFSVGHAHNVTGNSNSSANPSYDPTAFPMFAMSADPEFAFYLSEVLSLANEGGANTGEVLRAATQIIPHDFDSVYNAFNYLAEQINAIAESTNHTKDPVGARESYFRASSYYRAADFFLHGNWTDPRNDELWNKQLSAFDKAIALLRPVPGRRFSIKAHSPSIGDFEVIGTFYKSSRGKKRPVVVIGTGYDGSQEALYHSSVRQILARGMHAVTFEGPGQPTVVVKQGVGFIPDWWNVVTPIVDWLAEQDDVDMDRLALLGLSFGGILIPRAASREHRFSAVLAVDGFSNFTEILVKDLAGTPILDLYEAGKKAEFDEVLLAYAANTTTPSQLRWLVDQSLWSFHTHSPYEWWQQLSQIVVDAEIVKDLPMPVFVAKGQDDTSTQNQPEIAFELYKTARPDGVELTTWWEGLTSLGAGEHCSLGAEAQLGAAIVEWMGGVWGIEALGDSYFEE